ncbi:inovirus Gp2 family protein [Shewanella sp. KCT]|uniref:inovirus Gp2 family protein n=1 Tax=Shewanella sp. KCT TaxID=2569535 RepID=UPI0011824297|nr:inovirus Gp2 family protein [Shewanella sp. KCT]
MSAFSSNGLSVVYSDLFNGVNIMRFINGSYQSYLQSNFDLVDHVSSLYPKVFAVRVDLRLFDGISVSDNSVMTRFIESLKAQIEADYLSKRKEAQSVVHKSDVFYIWVREQGQDGKVHFHVCLFLNGNAYSSLGSFELGRNNLYNRIHKAWASALQKLCYWQESLDVDDVHGTIHFPLNGRYRLNRNEEGAEQQFEKLLYRLSYFAKVDTKYYGSRVRHYGCSRIPPKPA